MIQILGTKPNGEKMTEFETAFSCLQSIQQELERLNSSNGIREEIKLLIGITNETDNREAKKIMKGIVKTYQQLMLDVNSSFLAAKHKLDMQLLAEQSRKL